MIKHCFFSALVLILTLGSASSFSEQKEELNKLNFTPNARTVQKVDAWQFDLPAANDNRVAYYAFDATTVGQDKLRLTDFTDNANIVVVFEGTLWELADPAHYGSPDSYILNIDGGPYSRYEQILDDIQILRQRGVKVLMNLDDTRAWSTATPFTTWDGIKYNYQQFAKFVYDSVLAAGFDGVSLDVEHGAVDNSHYRNLIKELGNYFGPLSFNASSMIYTSAIYSRGAPGPIFREPELSQYLNFVMDIAYFQNDTYRFNYWANTLGNAKVMIGMSHQMDSYSRAVAHAQWHPSPDKAGIMVFAGNVRKQYTDGIFTALQGDCAPSELTPYVNVNNGGWAQTYKASLNPGGTVVLGPGPNSGSWRWVGPNNYSASIREISLSNISPSQSGTYIATQVNNCGGENSVSFTITVQ